MDAAAIACRAREAGGSVILDTYQSAGIVPVDVAALDVDFAVGGCLKWLCGGPGNAFLYMRPEARAGLRPSFTGWLAHRRPFAFDIDQAADEDLRDDAMGMMNGTPSIPAYYAALAGLDIVHEVSVARIRKRSKQLTARLLALVDAHGFSSAASRDPERLGGTVAVNVPDAQLVARTLKARDFLVDYRPPVGVRLSPHFYNTAEEVDRMMSEIVSIVARKDYDTREQHSVVTLALVRDGQFARHDRTCPRQPATPREVADECENCDEDGELETVTSPRSRQHLPHQPQRWLRPAHGPHRSVEVPPLVPFPFCRRLDPRQPTHGSERPDGARQRKVRVAVHLLQLPVTGDDGPHETGDVQHGERDHFAPRERVADAPIQRIRPILGEANDVRLGFDARQAAAETGNAGPQQDGAEPECHAGVEPALEQIEGERAWRDEEDKNPDRPVIEPVVELVVLADSPLRGVLDGDSVHGCFFFFAPFLDWSLFEAGERVALERRV